MTAEHLTTPEEEAYGQLIEEARKVFSAAAGALLSAAEEPAYANNLMTRYGIYPEKYEEATEKMRLAAAELSDRDHELLGKLWRAALAAAASIDPEDETPVAYEVRRGDLHRYYRTVSSMVERALREKATAEHRKNAERGPDESSQARF